MRGGWSAHGAQWVLPAVGSYRLTGGDTGGARPDYLSLDRSTAPDSLVASEWVSSGDDRGTRLWRSLAKPAYRSVTRVLLGWPERAGPIERRG